MEIILMAFITAVCKFGLLCKFFGLKKVLWFDKWIDLFFTIVLPIAFYGTFSGMILAVLSGLFLALLLLISKCFVKPEPPRWMQGRKRNAR